MQIYHEHIYSSVFHVNKAIENFDYFTCMLSNWLFHIIINEVEIIVLLGKNKCAFFSRNYLSDNCMEILTYLKDHLTVYLKLKNLCQLYSLLNAYHHIIVRNFEEI